MRRLQSATLPPPVFAQQKPPLRPTVAGVQELILDKDGSVLSSDDALFPIQKTIGEKPVFEWLPFLESVWPTLFSPDFLSKPHRFKAVQTALPELSGIYDFVFAATDFEKTPGRADR